MRKPRTRLLLIIVTIVLMAVVVGCGATNSSVTLSEPVEVTIKEGSSTDSIAQTLEEAGVVTSAGAFTRYVKKEDAAESLRSGTYEFSGEVSLADVVSALQSNSTVGKIKVTIPEGLTMQQTAARFAEASETITAEAFLDYAQNGEFAYEYLPAKGSKNRLEGFLFPETYWLDQEATAEEAVNLMLAEFDKNWTDEFQAEADKSKRSVFEVITMASLVEKEARVQEDRPIIAGVFYNRLEVDMPLQSCASIQYILGEPKEKLLNSDLEIESPYNTYQHTGLTPGPIASPGLASIKAALYPEDNKFLYFLAKPDGAHAFNETYEGHLKDKAQYID